MIVGCCFVVLGCLLMLFVDVHCSLLFVFSWLFVGFVVVVRFRVCCMLFVVGCSLFVVC